MGATAIIELLAAVAALVAAVFIFDQHLLRPRPYKLMWSLGLLFYSLGAGAAFAGSASHWTVGEYKAWYFFGGTVTAVFLGLGSLYLLGPRRVAHAVTAIVAVLSLYVAFRFLTDSVSNALATYIAMHGTDTQAVTGKTALDMLPADVRAIAIPLNILGGLFLFGGAAWSAWTFWRKRAPGYRLVSMALLALGAIFPGILTGVQALGNSGGAALGELLGALCLLGGLLISLDVFTVFRVPFTNIVVRERHPVEAKPART
ncbi:MAG TPA: hypothetical protein VKQ30_23650 [Ktedonobacterales bacterium]|nr:hypothetical protein [Ktedonobacterales bacterium]